MRNVSETTPGQWSRSVPYRYKQNANDTNNTDTPISTD